MVESEMFVAFVKYSTPKGPNKVVVSVFPDVIDKEFHRDQTEKFCPPLAKLPRKPKTGPPVSIIVTQSAKIKINKRKREQPPIHFYRTAWSSRI